MIKKKLILITVVVVGLIAVIPLAKAAMWYDEYGKQHRAPKDPNAGYLPEGPPTKDPKRPTGILDKNNEPPAPGIKVQNMWQQYNAGNRLIQV